MLRPSPRLDGGVFSFAPLQRWLFAALGLTALGCGGKVVVDGGAGGGSGGSGSTGSGAAGGGVVAPCPGAIPILQPDGKPSGFVRCADGAVDRAAPATCTVAVADTCQGNEMSFDCKTAADCTAQPFGSCISVSGGAPGPETTWCACSYQCATDADCQPGSACACAGVGGQEKAFCIGADGCLSGADCASGECGLSVYDDGCGTNRRLACRSAADSCRADASCPSDSPQCATSFDDDTFTCLSQNCQIGRPLLAGHTLLFAPAARRADWIAPLPCPEVDALSPELRAALAAHFTAMAAMEHASIGSFARASLELLALGAPPDLLRATHAAATDEILHAELSFALATAYAGEPRGPGSLPIDGVAPATEARAIAVALVREACVGETVAAAEALALSTMVVDPALVAVYRKVAEDEARHAELGFRTLAWMLERSPALLPAVEDAFSAAIGAMNGEGLIGSSVVSADHGLLSPASLAALRRKAVNDVVQPCRHAVLGRVRRSSSPAMEQATVA